MWRRRRGRKAAPVPDPACIDVSFLDALGTPRTRAEVSEQLRKAGIRGRKEAEAAAADTARIIRELHHLF